MKKIKIFTVVFCLLSFHWASAQDTLILINKDTIACYIEKVGRTEIEYKPIANRSKFIGIPKSEVWLIIYHSGIIDTIQYLPSSTKQFKDIDTSQNTEKNEWKNDKSANELVGYEKGYEVGFKEFRNGGNTLNGAIVAASYCNPPLTGLFSLIGSNSSIVPSLSKTPSYFRSNDDDFKMGYLAGAKLSRNKALGSANIIGTAAFIVTVISLISL